MNKPVRENLKISRNDLEQVQGAVVDTWRPNDILMGGRGGGLWTSRKWEAGTLISYYVQGSPTWGSMRPSPSQLSEAPHMGENAALNDLCL